MKTPALYDPSSLNSVNENTATRGTTAPLPQRDLTSPASHSETAATTKPASTSGSRVDTASGADRIESPLTPRHKYAAILLGAGYTQADAARALGLKKQTLCAWSKDQSFALAVEAEQEKFAEARRAELVQAARQKGRLVARAMQVLELAMNSDDLDIAIRAAVAVTQRLDRLASTSLVLPLVPEEATGSAA